MSKLLIRYSTFLLFLLLESACFYLVINYNPGPRSVFFSSTNRFSAELLQRRDKVKAYMGLSERMEQLQAEKAQLKAELASLKAQYSESVPVRDTSPDFRLIPARIFNKSTLGNNNWMTLDKGSEDGVVAGMGVINDNGVVGIVRSVSENYSLVMSVLHRDMRISGAIRNKGNHGLLLWRSSDPRMLDLDYIPRHVELQVGDTVVTSGYSNIFPKEIIIGTITSSRVPQGQSFHEVKVKLAYDFFDVDYVYIVDNPAREELTRLEASIPE